MTENEPLIKAYDEVSWARVHDSRSMPVGASLDLLHTLHRRWVVLLRLLGPTELDRRYVHPESGPQTLTETVASYAWHGRHHLAHIEHLAAREKWA